MALTGEQADAIYDEFYKKKVQPIIKIITNFMNRKYVRGMQLVVPYKEWIKGLPAYTQEEKDRIISAIIATYNADGMGWEVDYANEDFVFIRKPENDASLISSPDTEEEQLAQLVD